LKVVVRWLVRQAGLYLLLVVAVAFGALVWPRLATRAEKLELGTEMMSAREIASEFKSRQAQALSGFDARRTAIAAAPAAAVQERLRQARREHEVVSRRLAQ